LWRLSECHVRGYCRVDDSLKKKSGTEQTFHIAAVNREFSYFCPLNADNPVEITRRIVEKANRYGLGAGRQPGTLGFCINVENMGRTGKYWLFPEKRSNSYDFTSKLRTLKSVNFALFPKNCIFSIDRIGERFFSNFFSTSQKEKHEPHFIMLNCVLEWLS
jgi:hypothetical protein